MSRLSNLGRGPETHDIVRSMAKTNSYMLDIDTSKVVRVLEKRRQLPKTQNSGYDGKSTLSSYFFGPPKSDAFKTLAAFGSTSIPTHH